MSRLFRIVNPASGADLGTYEGDDKAAALDNYATRAGYDSFAAACEVTGDDAADDAGLRVVEVEAENIPHTPGPWSKEPSATGYRASIMAEGGRWHVADVCIFNEPGEAEDSEADANAALILAAPDLLTAAETVLRYLEDGTPTDERSDAENNAIIALVHAIRKAGGVLPSEYTRTLDTGADCPDCGNARVIGEGDGRRCATCNGEGANDLDGPGGAL